MADVNIFVKVKDEASQAFSNIGQAMENTANAATSFASKYSAQLKIAGAAMAGLGAAGLKMADDSRKINASFAQTAITLGTTTEDIRKLALETTNVTFKLESVKETFALLARAGVRSTAEMQATANAFDRLADATGDTAENVASMLIPAFKNMGVALPQVSKELDQFTWLTKNTLVSLSDFQQAMLYVAAYGDDLTITIDEMVAIMAALEEKGITGSAVTRVFRTAVSQAASGAATLNDALGLTQASIDGFKAKMQDATGVTDQYADAANTQYGIMDKLKQKYDELKLRIGSLMEPFEGVLGIMSSLSILMIAMTTTTIPKLVAAVRGLGAALMSAAPMLAVAGGAAYGLYKLHEAFSGTAYVAPPGTTEEQLARTREKYGLPPGASLEDIYNAQEAAKVQAEVNAQMSEYQNQLESVTTTLEQVEPELADFGQEVSNAADSTRRLIKAHTESINELYAKTTDPAARAELMAFSNLTGILTPQESYNWLHNLPLNIPRISQRISETYTPQPDPAYAHLIPLQMTPLQVNVQVDGQTIGSAMVGSLGQIAQGQIHMAGSR